MKVYILFWGRTVEGVFTSKKDAEIKLAKRKEIWHRDSWEIEEHEIIE